MRCNILYSTVWHEIRREERHLVGLLEGVEWYRVDSTEIDFSICITKCSTSSVICYRALCFWAIIFNVWLQLTVDSSSKEDVKKILLQLVNRFFFNFYYYFCWKSLETWMMGWRFLFEIFSNSGFKQHLSKLDILNANGVWHLSFVQYSLSFKKQRKSSGRGGCYD